ncbi:hypothetical protein ITI46_11470 [Streptomyces oryzae]|uniref:Uncharacterized protein n=1 Tax=Streptomyces oryzae TaxID=1434886 RepID=A0ABS3XA70_9ACTN|nr:hypothetical protein [Streptomyces oryzae]MBO8192281.1 hypothetical protein [Streptomyces oryzae]
MGRDATAVARMIAQAAPDGAPGTLHWWLLVGGSAGTVLTLVLSSACYRAFCRRGAPGLESAGFFAGVLGYVAVFVAFWGAVEIVDGAPSGPPAGTGAFLLLLAVTLGIGALLMAALIASRTARPPPQDRELEPVPETLIGLVVVADLVVAVLAALGAAGVLHLNLVKTVAWAYVGGGLGVVGALVLGALVWAVAGVAGP